VFFSSGFGPLSETGDFLRQLFDRPDRLASPMDFVGSVHNAPAGQLAQLLSAGGANVTATGGDISFEQALWMANHLAPDQRGEVLLVGADEHHPVLSTLLEPSFQDGAPGADGGAAFLLSQAPAGQASLSTSFLSGVPADPLPWRELIQALGGREALARSFGAVLVGLPSAYRAVGMERLSTFLRASGEIGPLIDYRPLLGEFASASACACFLALQLLQRGSVPAVLAGGRETPLAGRGVLVLSLAPSIAVIEVRPRGDRP
jgi:hypothetical protein